KVIREKKFKSLDDTESNQETSSTSHHLFREDRRMYTNIALVLFVSDTLIICCWAFTFCFAGEYLTNKTSSIGDAVYNSCWYEANSKDSRFIVFMIMRSQKQLTITIGKVLDLSMETVLYVCNTYFL
ncbi:Odorant receptor 346, partial [Nylanderia fulva]